MLRLITLGRLQLLRDGHPSEPIHLQPKRLALLAFLALALADGFQQRDTLLALFWPRSDRNRARRCLRQALFHLRNELGEGAIVNGGREGVALAPHRLWCDAVAVEEALLGRRRREALNLYAGDFLPGLFVNDSGAELEEWMERTRQHLRARVVAGAWELVEEELREQRTQSALETARRARGLSPDDEQGLRRHMVVLAQAGDPVSALGAYAEFTRRLRQEYDAEPSGESWALAEALKHGHLPAEASAETAPRRPATAASGAADRPPTHRRRRRRRADATVWVSRIALLVLLFLAGFAMGRPRVPRSIPPAGGHLLLIEFTNHTHDSLLGATVTEALRADLSQIAEVRLTSARAGRVSPDPPVGSRALAIVTGDVTAFGPGFTLSANLVSAGTGQVLAVVREDVTGSRFLLRTVERLSRRLRDNVIESVARPTQVSMQRRIPGWRNQGR